VVNVGAEAKGEVVIRSKAIDGIPEERQRSAPRLESRAVPTPAALYELYLDDVFRYVSRRVPRREEAEDVTAEVFGAAFAALPRFRSDCPPRLWLLGIARRKVADLLRRRRARPELLETELSAADTERRNASHAAEGREAAAQRAETCRLIRELMAELKEEQREALLLQYVDDLSIAEIAVVMGRSPAAINSLLQRGRASLLRRGKTVLLGEPGQEGKR
jgi:RNA polymerase sigma-70 factor (ECF subfamily)